MGMDTGSLLTLVGFAVSVVIAYWGFKRSEVTRIKDVFISKAEGLPEWLLAQINERDFYQIESLYSGKITHLEMRLKQLNRYANCEFANNDYLNRLRSVNLESMEKKDAFEVHSLVMDLIEVIEEEYYDFYYAVSWYDRYIKRYFHLLFYVVLIALKYSFLAILIYLIFKS